MHSIGFKVFLYYWVSVILVVFAANMFGPDTLRRPQLIKQTAVSSMAATGKILIGVFEQRGCEGLSSIRPKEVALVTPDGATLCDESSAQDIQQYAPIAEENGGVLSHRFKNYQLVLLPLTSKSGKAYVVALRSPYASPLLIFGWMPGPTTWVASFIASVLLAVVFSRPLRKLRLAARALATGDLSSRVNWNGFTYLDVFSRRDEIRGLMEDFNHMAAELQALVELQRTLLRDVSHELRSPLARLNVALELAREESDVSSGASRYLERIEREAALLNELITQLLSLSAIQHAREANRAQIVHLQQVIHELTEDARFEATTRKCMVTFQPIGEDYSVRGHERLLRGAIENVVRNAIQYSGDGGTVEIQLSTESRHEVSYAVISVTDNGPGIPQEDLRKIFHPFYRVDEARRRSTGGFGIGLSIVERSIELHSGKIMAANREGGGLIVAMYLPLAIQSEK